jgi:hypothetical protein
VHLATCCVWYRGYWRLSFTYTHNVLSYIP